jgi:hypothetical protein
VTDNTLICIIVAAMTDNTLICIIVAAMIGGCTACSVSKHRIDIEKLRIEHDHKIELLEASLKQTAPKP